MIDYRSHAYVVVDELSKRDVVLMNGFIALISFIYNDTNYHTLNLYFTAQQRGVTVGIGGIKKAKHCSRRRRNQEAGFHRLLSPMTPLGF